MFFGNKLNGWKKGKEKDIFKTAGYYFLADLHPNAFDEVVYFTGMLFYYEIDEGKKESRGTIKYLYNPKDQILDDDKEYWYYKIPFPNLTKLFGKQIRSKKAAYSNRVQRVKEKYFNTETGIEVL